MFLRKKIYIGETSNGVIYYNTKTGEILSANKSNLLNTEKSEQLNKFIPYLIVLFLSFGGLGITSFSFGEYNKTILMILIVLWVLEFIGMVILLEQALYKYVKHAVSSTKKEFQIAANENLFWNNFGDKRVTRGKKIWAWIITTIVTLCGFSPIMISKIINNLIGTNIKSEIVGFSMIGIMPAIMVIFIFQNNPIRFFKAVEEVRSNKYQKKMKKEEK
ncbi:hypothetical protein POF63_05460 [Streptococcus agalactiae]|uniref:hypothetical protein n=1 Tax=Streptococcus agalactiae TaxID=1311 RepID=UPI0002BACD00|nr:hypothetical protein [Streptococcus agalactiae]AIX04799.1 hypothetical protein W903_1114 [Streptococcus agalactiae CNCTC 10/84]EPT54731.1 hypothetical protein SAG0053_00565 [Streptococcus agalactiae CCUG 25532]EPT85330.1 hypothetical protein SAG0099_01970 [Streptococcus agalactiae BSU247]EPV19343.1 hypothetical protein SAG0334_01975 [Streptococcus agalactiae GB00640]EPW98297.1 hypothetical protein SAG0147_02245 [Streptococcus agalactiae MRI Z1-048]